ncbi:MAG: hypothetical protein HOP24_12575 [Sideroxydans sp.]|nr:hypothetical protein [Sideroxydans sp.]
MKKIIATVALSLISCSAVAEGFIGLGYAPSAKGGIIDGYTFEKTNYLTVIYAKTPEQELGVDWYIGGGMTVNLVDSSGSSNFHYSYTIMNVGATTKVTERIYGYAGVGYSIASGEYKSFGQTMQTKNTNSGSNLNGGIIFQITDSFGAWVNYDTAPGALGFGIAKKI